MITGKIDLNKLDKSKLFKGKDGAIYLDIAMFETPDSKYGDDYIIVQSLSKEDRDAGGQGAILGNAKTFTKGGATEPVTADDKLPWDN